MQRSVNVISIIYIVFIILQIYINFPRIATVCAKIANFAFMKVVVDDKIPYIKGKIEAVADEVVYMAGSAIAASDVRDADALIVRTRTRCDASLLEGSKVRLVVTATIGYDHIDTAYLKETGILWTNCPGCNATSVRQYVHNSLLALGKLRPGLTVGVVGLGHVGSLVAADLADAGLRVLLCDPPLQTLRAEGGEGWERSPLSMTTLRDAEFVSLEQIAEEADIVTFHTPLTRSGEHATYHLADDAFFSSLKRKPLIINSSRGEVVDNVALVKALDGGLVADAVIDTWEGEPDMNADLLERAVIATPHIAGYSADGKANATRMSLQAVCEFFGVPFALEVEPPQLPMELRPTAEDAAQRALQLYNPLDDTARLKSAPERFEWLRGNYPLRREFCD